MKVGPTRNIGRRHFTIYGGIVHNMSNTKKKELDKYTVKYKYGVTGYVDLN